MIRRRLAAAGALVAAVALVVSGCANQGGGEQQGGGPQAGAPSQPTDAVTVYRVQGGQWAVVGPAD